MKRAKKSKSETTGMVNGKVENQHDYERKKAIVNRLLDKKFNINKSLSDDCDSCGERCFD